MGGRHSRGMPGNGLFRLVFSLTVLASTRAAFGQAPVITSISPPRQAVLAGQLLTLNGSATSATAATYQWRRNGMPIPGATATSHVLGPTLARDSGWYQLVVTNASGSATSAAIFVNVGISPAHVVDWGQYYNNELVPLPTPPLGLTAIARIAASGAHSLALKHDGTVAAWGRPFEGQLNIPPGLSEIVAIATGWQHSLALRSNGTVVAWGSNSAGESNVPGALTNVVSISSGQSHSLALRSDGTAVAWGSNMSGEGSLPPTATGLIAIASGAQHNLGLRSDGTVVAWGSNTYGQTSIPAGLNNVVAIAAGFYQSLALRSNGTVVAWGRNDRGQTTVPGGLAGVIAIAGGNDVSFALKSDGTVSGWGSNIWGQLSIPAGLNQVADLSAGSQQVVALRSSAADTAPLISAHPLSQGARLQQFVQLSVTASGPFLRYAWRRNGVPLPFTNQPTLTLSSFQASDAGTYDVIVSNHIGSVTSNPAVLVLGAPPVFISQPNSVTIPAGQSVTFSATVSGDSPVTYQWHKNNASILGATNASYSIPSASIADVGIYYVTATNAAGTNSTTPVTLTLLSPPTFTTQPVSVTANPGQTVSFSVSATSNPAITSYQWRKNGMPIAGNSSANTSTLVLPNVTAADSGNYDVVATSPSGSTTSGAAVLTFPSAPVITAQPVALTVNQGQVGTLSVSAIAYPAIATYQWRRNGVALTGNSSAASSTLVISDIALIDAGSYDVVVTNPLGSTTSDAVTLIVRPRPVILTQPTPRAAVVGQSASFTVAAQNVDTYQWRKNGAPITGNPSATTATLSLANLSLADGATYDVVVTNIAGSVTSLPAALQVAAAAPSRLANLSVLTSLDSASDVLTIGTVVGGAGTTGEKVLLLRAVGPSLAQLNVPGVLDDPKLEFFRNPTLVGTNDNWGSSQAGELVAAATAVGAFPMIATASKDAALLSSGVVRADHSVRVASASGASGAVIAEIYDATPSDTFNASTPRLVNLSVLKRIDSGLTAGFVIVGSSAKTVLIRAIGPSLAQFNVESPAADPRLELFNDRQVSLATNDNWGGVLALVSAFGQVGAFPLEPTSRDAALVQTLEPGAYTVQIGATPGAGGTGLIEIYEVP